MKKSFWISVPFFIMLFWVYDEGLFLVGYPLYSIIRQEEHSISKRRNIMPFLHCLRKIFSLFSMMVLSLLDNFVFPIWLYLERFLGRLLMASNLYALPWFSRTGIDWSHTSRKEDSGFPILIIDLELQPEIS